MDPVSPVPVFSAVTFTAEKVRMFEIDQFPITEGAQVVPIFRIVTIKTPHFHIPVVELDVPVDKQRFPPMKVYREIPFRTVAGPAGSYSLGKGSEGHRELLIGTSA